MLSLEMASLPASVGATRGRPKHYSPCQPALVTITHGAPPQAGPSQATPGPQRALGARRSNASSHPKTADTARAVRSQPAFSRSHARRRQAFSRRLVLVLEAPAVQLHQVLRVRLGPLPQVVATQCSRSAAGSSPPPAAAAPSARCPPPARPSSSRSPAAPSPQPRVAGCPSPPRARGTHTHPPAAASTSASAGRTSPRSPSRSGPAPRAAPPAAAGSAAPAARPDHARTPARNTGTPGHTPSAGPASPTTKTCRGDPV